MVDLFKAMERERLHSEHAAQCFIEAKRRDNARKKNPKCPRCGSDGVLNTANADNGSASEWTCWAWQCHHVWKTPNLQGQRDDAALCGGSAAPQSWAATPGKTRS